VIVRVWRARLNPARLEAYRCFERERCLPMLRKQPGVLGVLFLRGTEAHAVSITFWETSVALEALESSPSYRKTTRELAESGLLAGAPSTEILDAAIGELRVEALAGTLERAWSSGALGTHPQRVPERG
jgi:heme-degrading monooxygenase HmoA